MKTLIVVAATLLALGSLSATPVNLSGRGNLQAVLDAFTRGGPSSVNVQTDQLSDVDDSAWSIRGGDEGSALASIMVELAGYRNQNRFGVYDLGNPGVRAELFAGGDRIGDRVNLEIGADGSVAIDGRDTGVDFGSENFGFYFETPDGVFYSNTLLNDDGVDHMVAYQGVGDRVRLPGIGNTVWGENGYILGLEDTFLGGDFDFNDMVVYIEGVQPTHAPEPGTLILVTSGTIAVGLYTRRRKNRVAER